MTLILYTSQYGYPGNDGLDTTLGGAWKAKEDGKPEPEGAIFAPPEWLLTGYKNWQKHKPSRNKISAKEYTPLYLKCMRQRWQQGGKQPMLNILKRYEASHGALVLRCFCADGDFCHTAILKDMLFSICLVEGIAVIDGGRIRYQASTKTWIKPSERGSA